MTHGVIDVYNASLIECVNNIKGAVHVPKSIALILTDRTYIIIFTRGLIFCSKFTDSIQFVKVILS